ncbi:MAG: hypothetical protein ACRC0V_11925, partial [Fusobacteriaceae bacterium]
MSDEIEIFLKNNITSLAEFNSYLEEKLLDKFDDEFEVNLMKRYNEKLNDFSNSFWDYLLSFIIPNFLLSTLSTNRNLESTILQLEIPDNIVKGDIDSALENILLLYKIEASISKCSPIPYKTFFLNIFDLKNSIKNRISEISSQLDIKGHLDKNFFQKESKKIKNSNHINFTFNDKISKIKVNRIFKEMKNLEFILELSIFDWNSLNSIDFKVFYNLFCLVYDNSTPFFPLQKFDLSNILKAIMGDSNCPDFIISSLLSISKEEKVYLEGNSNWNKNILTLNINGLENSLNEVKDNIKKIESLDHSSEEYKLIKNLINPLKNVQKIPKDFDDKIFLGKAAFNEEIISSKMNIKNIPLLGVGLEIEIQTDFQSDNFDKLFIVFDKKNIETVWDKFSLLSESSIGVFAVPKIFISDNKYLNIREKIAESKKIAGIIKLKKSDSPIYFKDSDEYYLLVLSGENKFINLMDQFDLEVNKNELSYFSYSEIQNFKNNFNKKSNYEYISQNEFHNLDLDEIAFSKNKDILSQKHI